MTRGPVIEGVLVARLPLLLLPLLPFYFRPAFLFFATSLLPTALQMQSALNMILKYDRGGYGLRLFLKGSTQCWTCYITVQTFKIIKCIYNFLYRISDNFNLNPKRFNELELCFHSFFWLFQQLKCLSIDSQFRRYFLWHFLIFSFGALISWLFTPPKTTQLVLTSWFIIFYSRAIIYLHMSLSQLFFYQISHLHFIANSWQSSSNCKFAFNARYSHFSSLCIKHPSVASSHGKQFGLHFSCRFSKRGLSNRFTCDLHKLSASFEAADDDDADVVAPALCSCSCPNPRGHFLGTPL